MTSRRTKRRYAHELFPHPDEWDDPRPLSVEPDARGSRFVTCVQGKESECPECTEEIPVTPA